MASSSLVRSMTGGGLQLPAASPSRSCGRSFRRRSCRRRSAASLLRGVVSGNATTSTSDARQLVRTTDELGVIGRDVVVDPLVVAAEENHGVNAARGAEEGGEAADQAGAVEVETLVLLRAIGEAAADRVGMHDVIGRQRDNGNHLLLHSTNSLALAASVMAALAPCSPSILALKASAGVLLASAAMIMAAVNKIQPSQLAEEQRNATRLWRQLERDVRATLALGTSLTKADVQDAMDLVLALDAAYPLPLLPGMLDKFPKAVELEPTRWWPKKNKPAHHSASSKTSHGARRSSMAGNGWSHELEEEMRGIARVLKAKDEQEYLSFGKLALKLNKGLAVAGPALAGTAALAASFIGTSGETGSWASGAAVLGGALAAAVNTVEHGGQVGMVFELCRNVAGFYREIQEEIEGILDEADVESRENGEVFEMKVALQLGRRPCDLKQFRVVASPSFRDEDIKDFAGKLF